MRQVHLLVGQPGPFTFWSVNRDRQCNPPGNYGVTSSECSSVPQNSWDFAAYTVAFARNRRWHRRRRRRHLPPSSLALAEPDPSSGDCSAASWVSNLAYVSGDVVSYGGDQWTANQWNYDEVPGSASGAWNNGGPC